MRAKVHVKDGNIADCRDHVEQYIETLDDQDLSKQLTPLRLNDVNTLKATLHTYERIQKRNGNLPASSSKFLSRSKSPYTSSPSKPARAVREIRVGGYGSSSESDISGLDSDEELQRVLQRYGSRPNDGSSK